MYICKGENTIGNWEYANRGKETISQLCRLIFVENSFVVMIRRKKKFTFIKEGERTREAEVVIVSELIRWK